MLLKRYKEIIEKYNLKYDKKGIDGKNANSLDFNVLTEEQLVDEIKKSQDGFLNIVSEIKYKHTYANYKEALYTALDLMKTRNINLKEAYNTLVKNGFVGYYNTLYKYYRKFKSEPPRMSDPAPHTEQTIVMPTTEEKQEEEVTDDGQ